MKITKMLRSTFCFLAVATTALTCAAIAEAAPLPLLASDPIEARSILRGLEKTFPTTQFCRKRPIQIEGHGEDKWARATFFDKDTCQGKADNPSHIVILQRSQTADWTTKCKEQRGDLPPYDYYFKRCGGMPIEVYRGLFGIED